MGSSLLYGVIAIGANDVWGRRVWHGQTLTMHWNGSQWSIIPSAASGTLFGISGRSASDIWAVGYSTPSPQTSLILHWDGTQWNVMPNPGTSNLMGVSEITPNDVWAVGETNSDQSHALIMHWDGSAWTVVSYSNTGRVTR